MPVDYRKYYANENAYRTGIKFRGLNFRVFGWQENSWGINFRGHSDVVGTIVVGIIFVDKRIPKFNTRTVNHNYFDYRNGRALILNVGRILRTVQFSLLIFQPIIPPQTEHIFNL